jgi:ACT domain
VRGSATYLLRLRLPDQPGALGQVASALGAVGADIQSIVVVDRVPEYAVDDLVVALAPDSLVDSLVTAAMSVPGVVVEIVQRHHGRMDPRDELALLDAAASATDPLGVLVDGLPGLLNASYALALGPAFLRPSFSAPSVPPLAGLAPLDGPRVVEPGELWPDPGTAGPDATLIAVPFAGSRALVLGRIGGPQFRPSELMRLAHLANVASAALTGLMTT